METRTPGICAMTAVVTPNCVLTHGDQVAKVATARLETVEKLEGPFRFILNGHEREMERPVITYEELVVMEYGEEAAGTHPSTVWHQKPGGSSGILLPGQSVQLGAARTVFDAYYTGNG